MRLPRTASVDLTVVLVHYRTPQLLRASLAAIEDELELLGGSSEVVVVDNSGDAALEPSNRARVLEPERNLGYAGGLRHGVDESRGRTLVLMNPDVRVDQGCFAALGDALRQGEAAAAGPRFFWDESRRLLLPPGEERSLVAELLRALSSRSPALARVARRRWRSHAQRHWCAEEPLESYELSGAMLAIQREAWERVGSFDAAYPLYFEETDWLLRARALGLRALHVPRATAVHRYDQSGRREPERQEWYEASCRRFREKHHGRLAARLLERAESIHAEHPALGAVPEIPTREHPLWVELSPLRRGFTAAAERGVGDISSWRLPVDVRAHHPDLDLHVTVCSNEGRELERYDLVET